MATVKEPTNIVIKPPKFGTVEILVEGTAPLVVARFSKKAELMAKMAEGASAKSKKTRTARDYDAEAEEARYRSQDGWEGFNASGLRCAMISACRLVGFKMTLAKLSVFVLPDGFATDLKTPIVRIYGDSITDTSHTRNATGVVDVRARPLYPKWASILKIHFDQDQFTTDDIYNLITRVGMQVGLCEGRPDSKSSAGMGWGTFRVIAHDEAKSVFERYGIGSK